jgi:hypothetical protein
VNSIKNPSNIGISYSVGFELLAASGEDLDLGSYVLANNLFIEIGTCTIS